MGRHGLVAESGPTLIKAAYGRTSARPCPLPLAQARAAASQSFRPSGVVNLEYLDGLLRPPGLIPLRPESLVVNDRPLQLGA